MNEVRRDAETKRLAPADFVARRADRFERAGQRLVGPAGLLPPTDMLAVHPQVLVGNGRTVAIKSPGRSASRTVRTKPYSPLKSSTTRRPSF